MKIPTNICGVHVLPASCRQIIDFRTVGQFPQNLRSAIEEHALPDLVFWKSLACRQDADSTLRV